MSLTSNIIHTPQCPGLSEEPAATEERSRLNVILSEVSMESLKSSSLSPLSKHILHGLAYTTGSALGLPPPTRGECLKAFQSPSKVGLSAGARAWSKHHHRSQGASSETDASQRTKSAGWWGTPSGPIDSINSRAHSLFSRIMDTATWRNLHWLPRQVLVYEVRVPEGYGMRWSRDCSNKSSLYGDDRVILHEPTWLFRGFLEPMMENGHEVGWRH